MLAALLLALAAPSALAGAAELEAARAQWNEMKLDEAAAALRKLVGRHNLAPSVDVEARILLGVTCTELGEFKEAEAAFVSALQRDPAATLPADLDAHGAPPRVRGLWEAAKLKIEPPPPPSNIAMPQAAVPPALGPPGALPDADDVDERPLPQPGVVQRVHPPQPPWLLIGAAASGGVGVILAGTAAVLDVAAGPDMFDGGTGSFVLFGAGAALLVTAGSLAVADVVASR